MDDLKNLSHQELISRLLRLEKENNELNKKNDALTKQINTTETNLKATKANLRKSERRVRKIEQQAEKSEQRAQQNMQRAVKAEAEIKVIKKEFKKRIFYPPIPSRTPQRTLEGIKRAAYPRG